MSNIWTAASEGDLERVKLCINQGQSPNAFDSNSYTPLHAAVSWSHTSVLLYLLEKGANINITDSDGETPLFVVESAEMARQLIQLGVDPTIKNNEGQSAAQQLEEDYPHISLYLRSITGEIFVPILSTNEESSFSSSTSSHPSSAVSPDLETPTSELMERVKMIMEASERGEITSLEVDEKLREVVESVVQGQVDAGREIGEMEGDADISIGSIREREEESGGNGVGKRRREEAGR